MSLSDRRHKFYNCILVKTDAVLSRNTGTGDTRSFNHPWKRECHCFMIGTVSLTLHICTRMHVYLTLTLYIRVYKDISLTLYIRVYKDISLTLYICTRTYLSLCTYVQGHISHSVCSDVYHYLSVLEASGVRSCLVPITASISWTLIYQTNTEYT